VHRLLRRPGLRPGSRSSPGSRSLRSQRALEQIFEGLPLARGWLAQCEYYQTVVTDYTRALEACRKGLALTPENAELLTSAALAEQGLGRWDEALGSLEKARKLDPRAALTARRLAHTLLRLRRYPEALVAADGASPCLRKISI
jgi:tetratricopeptide (TPR) repeat protein